METGGLGLRLERAVRLVPAELKHELVFATIRPRPMVAPLVLDLHLSQKLVTLKSAQLKQVRFCVCNFQASLFGPRTRIGTIILLRFCLKSTLLLKIKWKEHHYTFRYNESRDHK